MSVRIPLRAPVWIGIVAVSASIAGAAAAMPLLYKVVVAESTSQVSITAGAAMNVNPDFLNQFPIVAQMSGSSNTHPVGVGASQSHVCARVAGFGATWNSTLTSNGSTLTTMGANPFFCCSR
jgi:hypothetical protein